jgi:hypothetical protein
VSECTHVAVVAGLNALRIALAKLNLILLRVIELLNSVVRAWAAITQLAFISVLSRDYIRADLRSVSSKRSSSVFLCFMKIEAFLRVVLIYQLAGLYLEVE